MSKFSTNFNSKFFILKNNSLKKYKEYEHFSSDIALYGNKYDEIYKKYMILQKDLVFFVANF